MHIVKIPKRNGRFRTIYVPNEEEKEGLRELLPDLNQRAEAVAGETVHGFIPGRSPVTNALRHVGKAYTVTMDLEDFFDTVTERKLRGKLPREVLERVLVDGAARQGLPTSPAVANIAAADMDKAFLRWIEKSGRDIVYTRYADDLAFSFNDPKLVPVVIAKAKEIIGRCGFRVNPAKIRVQWAGAGRRVICGVAVGGYGIHPTREAKRRLRAARHQGRDGAARGLEEWCKLKPPTGKKERVSVPDLSGGYTDKEIEDLHALRKAWGLPKIAFRQALGEKVLSPRHLGGHCFITNDPGYFMGMSTFTSGWTSCMAQPRGQYREGVIAWLALPGASLAVLLGKRKARRREMRRHVMRARALVYKFEDGTLAYDKIYASTARDAEILKRALRAAGFVPVGQVEEGVYVAGSVPGRLPLPYLDSLKAVRQGDGTVRFRTRRGEER